MIVAKNEQMNKLIAAIQNDEVAFIAECMDCFMSTTGRFLLVGSQRKSVNELAAENGSKKIQAFIASTILESLLLDDMVCDDKNDAVDTIKEYLSSADDLNLLLVNGKSGYDILPLILHKSNIDDTFDGRAIHRHLVNAVLTENKAVTEYILGHGAANHVSFIVSEIVSTHGGIEIAKSLLPRLRTSILESEHKDIPWRLRSVFESYYRGYGVGAALDVLAYICGEDYGFLTKIEQQMGFSPFLSWFTVHEAAVSDIDEIKARGFAMSTGHWSHGSHDFMDNMLRAMDRMDVVSNNTVAKLVRVLDETKAHKSLLKEMTGRGSNVFSSSAAILYATNAKKLSGLVREHPLEVIAGNILATHKKNKKKGHFSPAMDRTDHIADTLVMLYKNGIDWRTSVDQEILANVNSMLAASTVKSASEFHNGLNMAKERVYGLSVDNIMCTDSNREDDGSEDPPFNPTM
jgi:hypothetical protein